jgi:hypothetical protein
MKALNDTKYLCEINNATYSLYIGRIIQDVALENTVFYAVAVKKQSSPTTYLWWHRGGEDV